MPKKYYYQGKLYAAKDWDMEKKMPLPKKAKVVELEAVEEPIIEDSATPDEAA